jgi:hypothetical protein
MQGVLDPPDEMLVDPLSFSATDVTGMHELDFDGVDGHRLVGDVAMTVAGAMDLPTSVPWALRDDRSARMLQEDRPMGVQVQRGAKLVVIPKSHLG